MTLKSFLVLGSSILRPGRSSYLWIFPSECFFSDISSSFYYIQQKNLYQTILTVHPSLSLCRADFTSELSLTCHPWGFSVELSFVPSLTGLPDLFYLIHPPHKTDLIHSSSVLESITGSSLPVKNNKIVLHKFTCKNNTIILLTRKK